MKKTNKNPFIELFLKKHPMWSSQMACAAEEARDAALDAAMEEQRSVGYFEALEHIKKLKSTNQRNS